jgi:type VI secretion system secreted protein Hcp
MEVTRACSLRYLSAVVLLALALALPTTARADLITLSFIPAIQGDVTVEGQKDTIEVLSLSGNIQESATGSPAGSRGRRGLPIFSDLTIQKRLDKSSPALFLALVKGQLFNSATITFLHETGDGFVKFFTITLGNVSLTKFATDDSESNVFVGHEQINLSYEKIQLKDELTGQSACWNISTASSC